MNGIKRLALSLVVFGMTMGVCAAGSSTMIGTPNGFGYVPKDSFINTGVSPSSNTRIEMRVWVAGPAEHWFGVWDTAWNNGSFCMGNDSTGVFTAVGSSASTDEFGYVKTIPAGIHTLAFTNGVFYCDGQVVASRSASFSVTRPLYFFAQNRQGVTFGNGDIWCQYARIYDGDALVKDYRAEISDGSVSFRELKSDTVALGPHSQKEITLVEYLESTASNGSWAYVNTYKSADDPGVYPTADTVVEACAAYAGKQIEFFGSWDSNGTYNWKSGNFGLAIDETGLYVGWGAGDKCTSYPAGKPSNGEWIFHLGPDFGGYISTDYSTTNSVLSDYSGQSFASARTKPLFLCAQNRGGAPAQNGQAASSTSRWRWFKIWESGVLMRHFVPVRFGTTACFFDTVRGGTYASASAVAFVAGSDVPPPAPVSLGQQSIEATATGAVISVPVTTPDDAEVSLVLSANGKTRSLEPVAVVADGDVRFEVGGLSPATEYLSRVIAVNVALGMVVTNDQRFTTAAGASQEVAHSVDDPIYAGGVFSGYLTVSEVEGTLRCFYGEEYGAETASDWAGSATVGTETAASGLIRFEVEVPAGTKYVRLAIDTTGGLKWCDAFATEWLDDGSSITPIPDTSALLSSYVRRFNATDNENLPGTPKLIANAAAEEFLAANAPRFCCPDADIERTYYFRWWTFRKHLRTYGDYYAVSEFLGDVSWAGKGNTIVCAAGHHFREGRWLRDPKYLASLARFWLTCPDATHRRDYVSWLYTSVCELADVTGDLSLAAELLDAAIANYSAWELGFTVDNYPGSGTSPMGGDGEGGFLSTDNREGSEITLSGNGYRPLVNSAMWAEADAIARMARRLCRDDVADLYAAKAAATRAALTSRCWNSTLGFFTVQHADKTTRSDVRELHGYAPWYFGVPVEGCAADWSQLSDPQGFAALYGLTFPERRADGFVLSYSGHECQWNGPSWPFATSIALSALARELHRGNAASETNTYLRLLKQYAVQHRLTYDAAEAEGSIVPWIDEDFDPDTFEWMARRILNNPAVERGKDYNHSTFCDLVISGLMGVTPNGTGSVIVDPIVPSDWKYFALENVRYHGHDLSVRYRRGGEGYRVLLDGNCVYSNAMPARVTVAFAENDPLSVIKLVQGEVSATLVGTHLTVAVPAGVLDDTMAVSLVWDTTDRGDAAADWANEKDLGFSVGAEGATNVVDVSEFGLARNIRCRLAFRSAAYTATSYVSARGGQWIDLGISEGAVCGFDFGFALNADTAANRWNSVFAGTLDNFTLGTIAGTHQEFYLRHRTNECYADDHNPKTILYANQKADMTVWNRAVLLNGKFVVNDIELASADTTLSVGTGGKNLHLFNNAGHQSNRSSDARCYYLKLYDCNGALIRDFVAAVDPDGKPCLYEKLSKDYYYAAGGSGALSYDSSTNQQLGGGAILLGESVRPPRRGMVLFFR